MNGKFTKEMRDYNIQVLENIITLLKSLPVYTPCTRCINFTEVTGVCGKYNETVPQNFREQGCDDFKDDIPF